jgi:hypothetical protein
MEGPKETEGIVVARMGLFMLGLAFGFWISKVVLGDPMKPLTIIQRDEPSHRPNDPATS